MGFYHRVSKIIPGKTNTAIHDLHLHGVWSSTARAGHWGIGQWLCHRLSCRNPEFDPTLSIHLIQGPNQAKIIKKSVILFWLLNVNKSID